MLGVYAGRGGALFAERCGTLYARCCCYSRCMLDIAVRLTFLLRLLYTGRCCCGLSILNVGRHCYGHWMPDVAVRFVRSMLRLQSWYAPCRGYSRCMLNVAAHWM